MNKTTILSSIGSKALCMFLLCLCLQTNSKAQTAGQSLSFDGVDDYIQLSGNNDC